MGNQSMRWIVVTGGSGFVGRYVVRQLRERGYRVAVVGRTNPTIDVDLFVKADIAEGTISDLPHCDACVHAAASLEQSVEAIRTNVLGTYNALKSASDCADKFIYISSLSVIGPIEQIPISESHAVKPQSLYHISKYQGESLCGLPEFSKLNTTILRFGSPVGRGMPSNVILTRFIDSCLNNLPIRLYGKGLREQNYIDTRDIAYAVSSAIAHPNVSGLFLLNGHAISNYMLAELCRKITNSGSVIEFTDIPDEQEDYRWIVDGTKAGRLLGYEPQIPLEQTIREIAGVMW